MNTFLSLLTHRSFFVRAAMGIIVGAVIFFGAWAASLVWLPEGFFLRLPLPSIGNCEPGVSQAWRTFIWNLVLTGGLTAFVSLLALNRFPYGYIVPWLMFAFYGGALGTNSFLCGEFSEPLPITLSVLWTRAGFRESMGYLLIAAALANQYLWRQPSFFKARVERVRSWKEFKLNLEVIFGPPIGFPQLGISEGTRQWIGLLAGGTVALLCTILPLVMVKDRVYRIGEE